jgi:hypothetical protein
VLLPRCRTLPFLPRFPPGPYNDITTEWATVKPPPVPELKPVDVDTKTTALLILDLIKTAAP